MIFHPAVTRGQAKRERAQQHAQPIGQPFRHEKDARFGGMPNVGANVQFRKSRDEREGRDIAWGDVRHVKRHDADPCLGVQPGAAKQLKQ